MLADIAAGTLDRAWLAESVNLIRVDGAGAQLAAERS